MMKLRHLAALAALLPLSSWAQLSVHEVHNPAPGGTDAPRMSQVTQLGHLESATALRLSKSRVKTPFVTSIEAPGAAMKASAKPAKISSVAELTGKRIMTYESLLTTQGNAGLTVTVAPLGSDSITITDFWESGMVVKAKVNTATSTISIPAQELYTHTTYGAMDLAVCTTSGKPDRTAEITGVIAADGTITLTGWWGVFVNASNASYADAVLVAYYNTMIDVPNATMSDTTFSGTSHSYSVKVTQTATNVLSVKNFGNHGMTLDIELNRARSGQIAKQKIWDYYTGGAANPFYTNGVTSWNDSTGAPKTVRSDGMIPLDTMPAGPCRKISWGWWTSLASGYYLGSLLTGSIETNFDIVFPELSINDFEGAGTEANPYIISSLDHLILLSDKVNGDREYNYTYYNNTYARSYLGKYFKITADIDMAGYRFDPIGNGFRQIFAGQVDGGNHVIKNLKVNTGSNGYAGLFGRLDTVSVVKNIILESPEVESTGIYVGGLCAWSLGELRNIHVTNPKVTTGGYAAGGMAGIAYNVYDCDVTGGVVTGNGYVGSLCGEVDNYIENAWGNTTKVMAGAYANNYPSGGLIGSMPYSTGKNLWFAGTVDGYTLPKQQNTSPNVGGITGALGDATLTNAFFVGTVLGYGTDGYVGGITARFQGSTMENCYSRGRIGSYYSRKTGGLAGYTMVFGSGDNMRQPVVKNCYTATSITAETYQYDTANTNVETLGTLADGVLPQVENMYYDKQLFDMGSEKYSTPATTAELTSAAGPKGFDSSVWSFTEGQYPRLKANANTEAAEWSASSLQFVGNNSLSLFSNSSKLVPVGATIFGFYMDGYLKTEGHYTSITGNTIAPNGKGAGQDTLLVLNGTNSFYYVLDVVDVRLEGNGDEVSPYLIKDAQDLIWLSQTTTQGGILFPNTYFKVVNDIDLGLSEEFLGICTDSKTAANKFAGVIDGDGHTIHQMKFARVDWTTKPTETTLGTASTADTKAYAGFVGRLGETGVVKNINFADDCELEFWASSGAAVGYNYGTVDNVRNYADVTSVSCWGGGVVGYNLKGATIRNCYNAGNVRTSYNNIGGITGSNYGTIENCVNVGDISAYKFVTNFKLQNLVGGITGGMSGGIVRNCANYGKVYGEQGNTGGISGSLGQTTSATIGSGNNDLTGALSVGIVSTADLATIGSIGGAPSGSNTQTSGEVKAAYYDQQVVPYPAVSNKPLDGCIGANTAVLTSGQALDGLDKELWQFDAGMYPTLKQFAAEKKLTEARKLLVNLPDGTSINDLNHGGATSGTLSQGAGMSWSYTGASEISIDGNSLKFPATVEKIISGILTGTNGTFTKVMPVQCVPMVPLQGDGTEASPYLISSADDWNALASYVNSVGNNFEGKYLKVTADISFEGKTFKPLFCDGVTPLAGTFDGGNHTVSGVAMTPTASYQAPFGEISDKGVLKNLTLEGEITTTFTYTGGFTGKVYGTLENLTNKVMVSTNKSGASGFGYLYTGAKLTDVVNKALMTGTTSYVCGIATNAAEGVKFTRVGNEGMITSSANSTTSTGTAIFVAGLVGQTYPNVFTECYNKGEIKLPNNNMYRVGGLVAYANATAAGADSLIFNKCYNTGDITASWLVSGIVGEMNASTTIINRLFMTECYNTGTIQAKGCTAASKSPGASGLSSHFTAGSEIVDCWNSGFITNLTNGNYVITYASGLLNYYKTSPTAALPMIVKRCFNVGEVSSTGNQVGGIFAYCSNYTTIDSCWNSADITGGFGVGGIVDCLGGAASTITRCWNSGTITGGDNRVGGLIGYNANAATTSDSFNVGNIINTGEVKTATNGNVTGGYGTGGIAGQAGIVTRCYNMGRVTGKCRVGGLVGYPIKNTSKISDCYFAGTLVAPADTAGSIYGIALENNGSLWTATNELTNCLYTTQPDSIHKQGTAVTRAELASTTDKLSNAWNYGDQYTFPMLLSNMPDIAKVFAAQVITQNDEPLTAVTKNFFVGLPDGVTWSASTPELTLEGSKYVWSTKGFKDAFTLTATLGDYRNVFAMKANVGSGVGSVDGVEVTGESFFTTGGMRVEKPEINSGNFYVVVRTYSDGTTKTTVEKF